MNKSLPRWVPFLAIGAAFLLAFNLLASARKSANSVSGASVNGKLCPAIEGPTHTGETFRLADHKGKVVLVNFWATWCGPCNSEIPDLIAVQKKYADKGFTIVGVSTNDPMPAIKDFAKVKNINYPLVQLNLSEEDARASFNGLEFIPQSYLVDKNGNIVHSWEGIVSEESLEAEIEKAL